MIECHLVFPCPVLLKQKDALRIEAQRNSLRKRESGRLGHMHLRCMPSKDSKKGEQDSFHLCISVVDICHSKAEFLEK